MQDVIVIGGGIAGLSCAAELARSHDVTLIEREDRMGYHSTGRSAAVYIEPYLEDLICRLTQLSRAVFESPEAWTDGFPVLATRGDMRLINAGDTDHATSYLERWQTLCPSLVRIPSDRIRDYLPNVTLSEGTTGVWNPDVFDIDVHAVCESYRRALRERGGELHVARELFGAHRADGCWRLSTNAGELSAARIVNASGAWADTVAERCGVRALGLQPKQRTIVQIAPWQESTLEWPMVHDAYNSWYLKPDGPRLLISPADESPAEPKDARADELDVATAVARIEKTFGTKVERVLGRWAGLRTFAPDNIPIIGPDPAEPDFIWCSGQGGFGIQTAPALGLLTARAVSGEALPQSFRDAGINLEGLAPGRLRPLG